MNPMAVSTLAGALVMCAGTLVAVVVAAGPVVKLDDAVRRQCLDVLRNGLHSSDFWPSIHAAEGLTLAGYGREVRSHLEPRLVSEQDDQRRCGLARELVRAGDRSRAAVMLDILAGSDDHGHVHAAESLYKVNETGDGHALRRAFATRENLRLRVMAAAALGRAGSPAAMTVLREILQHPDEEVARLAAWVLGRIGSQSDISRLRERLGAVDGKLARAFFEHALAALGDPDGQRALLRNLNSRDAAIRTYAAVFAGECRLADAVPRLQEMLNDPEPDAAIRAAQALLWLSRDDPS